MCCSANYEYGGGGGGAIAIPLVSGGLKDCLKGLGYALVGTVTSIVTGRFISNIKAKASASHESSKQKSRKFKTRGRAKNKLKPNPNAQGDHTTFKRNPNTNEITNYETWKKNPKNPKGFDSQKRYDGIGRPHKNPFTNEKLMPHVHDKTVPGNIRKPIPWEIPRKY